MAFDAALKNHAATWMVLFMAHGMKNLVNQVEVAFARSLVVCEELLADSYTGSLWCGDRLEVIKVGYSISQRGQSQESCAMLLSITLVAVLSAVYGRKLMLLLGLCGTTISVSLFILASMFPHWARSLFVLGQALQGLLPIDHLAGLIIFDLSTKGDGLAVYQVKGLLDAIGGVLWGPILGNIVQYLELVNYQNVWMLIFGLNVAALSLAGFVMPEPMDRPKQERQDTSGSASKVWEEVMSYRDVWQNPLSWRFLLMVCIEPCWMHFLSMIPVQLMAYHAWSQADVSLLILIHPLFIVFFPIVPKLCLTYGYSRIMKLSLIYLYGVLMLVNLTMPLSDKLPVAGLLLFTMVSGFMSLKEFVDSRFSNPEEMARFKSVQWVLGYVLGMGIGPVYASIFDSKADGYLSRGLPNFLAVFLMVVQILHVTFVMSPCMTVTLDLMDEGEENLKRLYNLITDHSKQPLDAALWKESGLEIFGNFEDKKGPFPSLESFREFVKQEGGATNDDARACIAKMDALLASRTGKEPKKDQ